MPQRLSRFDSFLEPKIQKREVADIPNFQEPLIHLIINRDEDFRLLLDELNLFLRHEVLVSTRILEPAPCIALRHQIDRLREIFSLLLIGIERVFDEFGRNVVLVFDVLHESRDCHRFGSVVELLFYSPDLVLHLGAGSLVG